MSKRNTTLKKRYTKMSTERLLAVIAKGGMTTRCAHWAATILSHRIDS